MIWEILKLSEAKRQQESNYTVVQLLELGDLTLLISVLCSTCANVPCVLE